jgi:hypothetical protein
MNTKAEIETEKWDHTRDRYWSIHEIGCDTFWRYTRILSGKNPKSIKDKEKDETKGKYFSIYLDAPVGICLMYKDNPSALTSFMPETKDTLTIHQLQGIRPFRRYYENEELKGKTISSRGTFGIDWQKLLVTYAENLAKKIGFKRIGIQGGHNNLWIKPNRYAEKAHITLEEALKSYDEVAERIGYAQENNKNWYKNV